MPDRQLPKRERGSTLVELTICLVAFLLLTLGAMEMGYAVYGYNFCSYAAQDAARWASVHGSQSSTPATASSVTSYVTAEAVGLSSSNLSVNTTWSPDNNPGSTVTVTVSYTVQPLAGLAIPQSFNVGSTAQFVINH